MADVSLPAAKKAKNAWTLTAALIRNLDNAACPRPSTSAAIARLTSSTVVQHTMASMAPPPPMMNNAHAIPTVVAPTTSAPSSAPGGAPSSSAAGGSGGGGTGGLKVTFRMAPPALVDGEEDVFVDHVDGLPGDPALKIFGVRKQLCVRPGPGPGEDPAAYVALAKKEREECVAAEETFVSDGAELQPGVGDVTTLNKPRRQKTPEPPPERIQHPIPPRNPDQTAGGEPYFMANWRWFLEWNLKKDPDEILKKLDNNQNRSGKPFDVYGFYSAVVSRGGYQDEDFAKANISMVEVYRDMHNHRNGHTYTSIGNILHKLYQAYFLGYELRHPEDINDDSCFVCGKLSGSMISCDVCDRWTHVKCHRRGAKRSAGVTFISARATTEIEFVCDECWRKDRDENP